MRVLDQKTKVWGGVGCDTGSDQGTYRDVRMTVGMMAMAWDCWAACVDQGSQGCGAGQVCC